MLVSRDSLVIALRSADSPTQLRMKMSIFHARLKDFLQRICSALAYARLTPPNGPPRACRSNRFGTQGSFRFALLSLALLYGSCAKGDSALLVPLKPTPELARALREGDARKTASELKRTILAPIDEFIVKKVRVDRGNTSRELSMIEGLTLQIAEGDRFDRRRAEALALWLKSRLESVCSKLHNSPHLGMRASVIAPSNDERLSARLVAAGIDQATTLLAFVEQRFNTNGTPVAISDSGLVELAERVASTDSDPVPAELHGSHYFPTRGEIAAKWALWLIGLPVMSVFGFGLLLLAKRRIHFPWLLGLGMLSTAAFIGAVWIGELMSDEFDSIAAASVGLLTTGPHLLVLWLSMRRLREISIAQDPADLVRRAFRDPGGLVTIHDPTPYRAAVLQSKAVLILHAGATLFAIVGLVG